MARRSFPTRQMCAKWSESLTTAFVQLNSRSERVKRLLDSNLASILQTIGNGLGCAVDSNRHAINPGVHNTLGQCSAREANEAHFQPVQGRLSSLAINGHPNGIGGRRKKRMKLECRFEAHDSMRHTLARENYPIVQRSGKVLRSIEPAMDLYKSPSIECSPKNLMVNPIFFQLRSTNYSKPIRERADAFRLGGSSLRTRSRHLGFRRCSVVALRPLNRIIIFNACDTLREFRDLHHRPRTAFAR